MFGPTIKYRFVVPDEVETNEPLSDEDLYEHLRDMVEKRRYWVVNVALPESEV